MRILYFHQHFTTPSGAGGTRSYEMARRLVEAGHTVVMVCGSYAGGDTGLRMRFQRGVRRGEVDGIDVVEFELAYSNRDGWLRRIRTFLGYATRSGLTAMREPCEVVFATSTPLTAAIPGLLARWLRGRTFVFEVRDLWPELPRAMGVIRNPLLLWAMSMLEWAAYRSAHRLIGLAPGIVEGIEGRGVPADRVRSIPNGCDLALFAGDGERWVPDGVATNDLLAVYCGTHGIANGLDAVIDAAVELQRRNRLDIRIALVGDGMRKSELGRRVAGEGLGNVLMHPPVGKRRVAALLRRADVGLQVLANVPAFYRGTSPNKFFDYLASGTPVLVNYPGWVADLVEREGCGVVVPPQDPVAFADALEWFADHREVRGGMGAAAKDLARREFDRDALGRRFVNWVGGGEASGPPAGTPSDRIRSGVFPP